MLDRSFTVESQHTSLVDFKGGEKDKRSVTKHVRMTNQTKSKIEFMRHSTLKNDNDEILKENYIKDLNRKNEKLEPYIKNLS